MQIFTKLFAVAALVLVSSSVVAQGKIAVFNPQAAMFNTNIAKQRLTELRAKPEYAAIQAKFESLKVDMQELQKEAKTNGVTWSQEQLAANRKQMEYKRADLELAAKKLQAEEKAAMQRILQELGPKMQTVFNQLVTAEGIGLVLDSKAAHFAEASYDLTAKITDKLNTSK